MPNMHHSHSLLVLSSIPYSIPSVQSDESPCFSEFLLSTEKENIPCPQLLGHSERERERESAARVQQENGWPLGLQQLNARVGIIRNHDHDGSTSFSSLLTASPSSSFSSSLSRSHPDTESTGSFFHDKNNSLGSLIGASSILQLSSRLTRGRPSETLREQKNCYKSKPWLFSLCPKLSTDAVNTNNNTPSLAYFLEAERRATNIYKRNQVPVIIGPDVFSNVRPDSGLNLLSSRLGSNVGRRSLMVLFEHDYGFGAPMLFSCFCRPLY
ncbi:hypothetical protein NMG60_11000379 [Bertholletia excelsa]